jgi:hypothetical protein
MDIKIVETEFDFIRQTSENMLSIFYPIRIANWIQLEIG